MANSDRSILARIRDEPTRQAVRVVQDRLDNLPQIPTNLLTVEAAAALYDPLVVRTSLQAGGANPLSVTNLRGVLFDPQPMGIKIWPDGNPDLPAISTAKVGEVLTWKGVLYYFDPQPNPGAWKPLTASALLLSGTHASRLLSYPAAANPIGLTFWETDRLALYIIINLAGVHTWTIMEGVGGPMRGTLSPDLKPADLGLRDAGFRFLSTDFNRPYIWTGLVWTDAPECQSRWQIGFFDHEPEPLVGWMLCDGSTATRSTSDGLTTPYTSPDLLSVSRFLRGVPIASGGTTGGVELHTHSFTGGGTTGIPSDTTEVQAPSGSVVRVASDTHTHNVPSGGTIDDANAEPPWYGATPYIRI